VSLALAGTVKLANAIGPAAEQVTYPGEERGFDFPDTAPMTADAIGRSDERRPALNCLAAR
jgi:hypothetical protein